jgi:hypothetical protein
MLPFVFCCIALLSFGQRPYNSIVQDTIIAKPGFLSTTYLLDGKALNLQVMDFFMADHPSAQAHIKIAILTDQLSFTGYGVGGLFLLTGILSRDNNSRLSKDLIRYGAITMGSGLLFQIISKNYQKNAVAFYNEGIKAHYRRERNNAYLELGAGAQGLKMSFGF